MVVFIVLGVLIIGAGISIFCYIKFALDSFVFGLSIFFSITSIIMLLSMAIGAIISFASSEENYNALLEERKGIEFVCTNMLDIYTDKLELTNSDLIKRANNFNITLAVRKAFSHNWFSGLLISDYADDIEPISYDFILQNYNKLNKNYSVVIEPPIPVYEK